MDQNHKGGHDKQGKKNNSGTVGKKCGHGKKKEEGGDRKCLKGDTKNKTNSMVEADTQPRRAQ